MANSATVNTDAGIVEVVVDGPQTKESIVDLTKKAGRAAEQASVVYGQVLTLADASHMGQMDVATETAALLGFRVVSFDRLAIVVADEQLRTALEAAAKLSGKGSQVQFFDDQPAARSWLAGA
ncbi:MAG: STAS/SEC14 domain-containing protein [Patescibacteria group bacterium]